VLRGFSCGEVLEQLTWGEKKTKGRRKGEEEGEVR